MQFRILATALTLAATLGACAPRGSNDAGEPQSAEGAPSSTLGNLDNWPSVDAPSMSDAALETRIDELLSAMSLEQKVGQIIQADSSSVTPEEVATYHLGSVLSGGNSAPKGKAYATMDEWLEMADALYEASIRPSDSGPTIPLILGIDAVHGHNNVIGGTIFPHNIGLGAARDPALVRKIAEATAKELRTTGHDWTFAPTVAVPQDDRWGRTYEGFSEDPAVVASYAGEIVKGLQGEVGADDFLGADRVLSTAKHYLGDGGTDEGRDQGDAKASEAEFARIHAAGYPPAIEAGALSVMASFSSWQGRPLHGHDYLLTDVLKEKMGFDGFVVGDWNGHAKVEGCTAESCAQAVNAGLDMFMAPDSWKGLYANTLEQAKSGEISAARLDDAVRRILRAKFALGLFEQGKPSTRPLAGDASVLGSPAHRALARDAVRKTLVLLKNENRVLPLRRDLTVLVAGDGAADIAKQSGGWTLTWQGGDLANALFPNGQTIFDGIRETVGAAGGHAVLSEDGLYDEKPDVAIVVFGENPYAEFQGDRANVAFEEQGGETLALLRRLKSEGVAVVAVFLSGRPLWVNPYINPSDAFVAAWLPGTEGGGVADVLFRNAEGGVGHDFTGKLSFSWPKTATQTPLNFGDAGYDPLFALGYGLSYADDGALAALSEESGIDDAGRVATGAFFSEGRAAPGLSLKVGPSIYAASVGGLDVAVSRIDYQAQEDAVRFVFPESGGAAVLASEAPIDISRETTGQLELSFAVLVESAAAGDIRVGMTCGEGCAGTAPVAALLDGTRGAGWRRVRYSLSCFRDAGADMSRISAPFVLTADAGLDIGIADIRLVQDANGAQDCGAVEN